MEKNINISTIGYEGANRTGKGTQIALMSELLCANMIPHVVLRGDGSRNGDGTVPGDPYSEWWLSMNPKLRDPNEPKELWNTSSYRLARELIVWRERIMPNILKELGLDFGLILIDRSALSRTLVPREITPDILPSEIDLYQDRMRETSASGQYKGKEVKLADVVPDIIFEFTVPKEILLQRFDDSDPKNTFRRWLVEERYDWYMNASSYIPEEHRSRIIRLDANRPPSEIFSDVLYNIERNLNLTF